MRFAQPVASLQPWRALGWLLPHGAAVDALRGVNFFAGEAITGTLEVLISWAVFGLLVTALPLIRPRTSQAITHQDRAASVSHTH